MQFEPLRALYRMQIDTAQIKPQWEAAYDRAAAQLIRNKARYTAIERATGVPWAWIACAHWRESSGSFAGILHNGERIIGTGRKTRLAPYGRGPFSSWEQAAVDALKIKGLHRLNAHEWTDERACYEFERFNGFGYRRPGRPNSPYLWAGTNLYTRGKFTTDHGYDSSHVDQQIGTVMLYFRLKEAPAEIILPQVSTKVSVLTRIKQAITGLVTTIAGLFSLETWGFVREWFSFSGFFDPKLQITLGICLLVMYVLITWLIGMIRSDYEKGHYKPSGECTEVECPDFHAPDDEWSGPAND